MRNENSDRKFPALRLAKTPHGDDPAVTHKLMLAELARRLGQDNVFTKGQFVTWKPGFKNRRFPDYGEPVMVTAVLSPPLLDPSETDSASPYFLEPLSLVIGTSRDDDFVEFHVDARRFEPVADGSAT